MRLLERQRSDDSGTASGLLAPRFLTARLLMMAGVAAGGAGPVTAPGLTLAGWSAAGDEDGAPDSRLPAFGMMVFCQRQPAEQA